MKPYIEYKGKTYEFEANFKLQKEFRKEYRKGKGDAGRCQNISLTRSSPATKASTSARVV